MRIAAQWPWWIQIDPHLRSKTTAKAVDQPQQEDHDVDKSDVEALHSSQGEEHGKIGASADSCTC